ncbi:MAG: DNA polymerase II [Phycisphaeraceae bacterium]|nr:DNA polymerase II [Phycisphaeraceae bacterium]
MSRSARHPDAIGFLLDVFHRRKGDRFAVFGIGRLESGETFGFVDDREPPGFWIRASELDRAQHLAPAEGIAIDPVHAVDPNQWTTLDGETVTFAGGERLADTKAFATRLEEHGVRTYEADISPSRRFLINRGIRGGVRVHGPWQPGHDVDRVYLDPDLAPEDWAPALAVLALDIETDARAERVYAVSLVGTGPGPRHVTEEVHLVGRPGDDDPDCATCHPDETALLDAVADRIRRIDPDVITGWNVIDFDLRVLQERAEAIGSPMKLGRAGDTSWYRQGDAWGGSRVTIRGRQVVDAMRLVRVIPRRFEDYRLGTVARDILGRDKTLESDEDTSMPEVIMRAYREDRPAFCAYCLEDSRLVRDILEATGLVAMTLRRSMLTGLALENAWGSIAAFDFLYLDRLHRQRIVAPTLGVDRKDAGGAPGGLVMPARAGLHPHVFVFDFMSLYPSIISTFNIDPLAHVRAESLPSSDVITAPNGATFAREQGILPAMLEEFFAQRSTAKGAGDELASFTYKIVMNSFYGVLASGSCRFASPRLAGAITGFGHELLRWAAAALDDLGAAVLYGDTDSLFVDARLPDDIALDDALEHGRRLCDRMNRMIADHLREKYGVSSRLELEFEKYYRRLFLPVSRADETRARAKGYAGLRMAPGVEEVEIIGMEAARHDWTNLAHDLQRRLLDLLFHDAPPGDIEQCVARCVEDVRAGRRDADLVYRKRLRKKVDDYTRTSPPHVKAARLLSKPPSVIHYVMTTDGPQPVGHVSAPLDYGHYVDKQIRPIVHAIAQVCDIDEQVGGMKQLMLFDVRSRI